MSSERERSKSSAASSSSSSSNNNNAATAKVTLPSAELPAKRVQHRLKATLCPISAVTVFNDRAEITRSATVEIEATGGHEVIIYDLSPEIQPDSIRVVGGEGNAIILEVSHEEVYGDREDLDKTAILVKAIEASLVERKRLNSTLERNQKERVWLEGFSQTMRAGGSAAIAPALTTVGTDVGAFLKNTSDFLSYYSDQIKRLDESDFSTNEAIKHLTIEEGKVKKQIASLQQHDLLAFRREVAVVLQVDQPAKITLQLSYIIMNAQWVPSYDVRMSSETDRLELIYFGSITNKSGEDWTNVRLYLSTASPSIGGAPPPLRTLRVEFTRNYPNYGSTYGGLSNSSRSYLDPPPPPKSTSFLEQEMDVETKNVHQQIMSNLDDMLMRGESVQSYVDKTEDLKNNARIFKKQANVHGRHRFTSPSKARETAGPGTLSVQTSFAQTSHVGAANATFEIPLVATIVSDNKPHKVSVAHIELKANLSYYATPDTSGYVYLKASAVNSTEQYPFLAGPMNIFMNSNFVAKSTMNDVSPGEKFSVFLGVDPGVKLDVKPVRRFQEKQTGVIYKNNSETFKHTSIIKNTRKEKVNLTVLSQIPYSTDDKIKVKLNKPDLRDGVKFVDNKLLKWKLVLGVGAQEEIVYQYNIEWPSGTNITHLTSYEA